MTPRPSLTRAARKPKFRVGQMVVTKAGRIIRIAAILDGKLYEQAGSGSFFSGCLTEISDVRPLTKRERGQ